MTFTGHVQNGAVVLSGPLPLPDGTAVEVRVPDAASQPRSLAPSVFDVFGRASRLRGADDIAEQLREERTAWAES